MKVVLCSSEATPFAKTGGMADVCGALPSALAKCGLDVTVILPKYRCIDKRKFELKRLGKGVASTQFIKDIQVLFIENEKYFGRRGLYGTSRGDYPDNLERFQYFSQTALDILKLLNLKADVVHCHDWQTSLIPAYVKLVLGKDPFFKDTKTVLSLHNLAYQGLFPKEEFLKTGLDNKHFSPEGFEFYGKVSLLKGGIIFADRVVTVSPNYAKEILTQEFGCGLEGVLNAQRDSVAGILNGLDYKYWNPETDPLIKENYDSTLSVAKANNKAELQRAFGLPVKPDVPVFGFVGRMSHQKGLDLIDEAMADCVKEDVQFVLLGVGEEKYQGICRALVSRFPEKVGIHLNFNEKLAHQVYAGSDFFIMPSLYEPCGLSQMISLRYATIPLVSHVGGLADTISPFEDDGNGVVFKKYTKDGFLKAVLKAVMLYKDKARFGKLREKALRQHFGWEHSAREYIKIYNQLSSA